jgi:phosphoglycolate phosphatase-like HAD superfamily hydrolase
MTDHQTLDLSRIRALCFDVDGTLSDTDDQFVENLVRLLNPLRFLFPNHNARSFARRVVMSTETPANAIYGISDHLGIDGRLNALGNAIYKMGLGKSTAPFQLIAGVQSTLQICKERYPLAIVSARGKRSTERFISQFRLGDFFQVVVSAQTTRHTKPFPDPIHWAARKMGLCSAECLMIGDTTVDITAARRAGAQSVGVLCGFGGENELRKAGATLILETTSDLPRHLFIPPN